jgi:hypothetical protein
MKQRLCACRLWLQAKKAIRLRDCPAWKITFFMIPYRWRQHVLLAAAAVLAAVFIPGAAISALMLWIGFYAADMLWHYRTGRDWQYTKMLLDWQKTETLSKTPSICAAELDKVGLL